MERDFKILPSLNVIFDLNLNIIKIVSGNLMNVFIYGNAQIGERFLNLLTCAPIFEHFVKNVHNQIKMSVALEP